MKSNILYKTNSGNNYFFNQKNQCSFLLHPILIYLLGLDNKNVDLIKWFNNNKGNSIKITDVGYVSKNDIK